jgi:hypothetical protein
MHSVITHCGVPIATLELPLAGDRLTIPVRPLPAYAAIQPFVRRASAALADVALGRPADAVALQNAANLGRILEVRNSVGALVAVDFIELTDWPDGSPSVAAFVRLRHAHAPVPAVIPPGPGSDSSGSTPAA